MILALARQLPAALDAQRTTRDWAQEEIRKRSTLLGGQTALILGYGRIARRLSELLLPLRLELIGVRRQVRGDEPIRVVTEREVSAILPLADHIINILPASDGTRDFLDAERLGIAKPGAILYNIGRGTTVNQDALIGALQSGRLSAAYLDVTDPEPLPPDHPLWSAPNCYITPHTAGGHTVEFERLVRHFLNNLRRYAAGDALIDRII
jgi:phosphoglycerate dehydrogenase-like enzyme